MTPILSCPKCGNPTSQRSRQEIADRIQEVVLMCARTPEDWVRRFQMLSANMMWLEGELRGLCTNCVVEYAAIEHGDLVVKTQRAALHVCQIIPIDEMRDRQSGGHKP